MAQGRASFLKILPLIIVGAIVGRIMASMASGSSVFSWLIGLLVVGFGAYLVWLFAFKNQATRKATPAQTAAALNFQPEPGQGVIYLYRKQFVAVLVGMDVVLDGDLIGQTRGFCFYRLVVEPGRHVLGGDGKCKDPLSFEVAAGEVAYIEKEILMGALKGGYHYRRIDDVAAAQATIRSCKLLLPKG
ncbi:hypothetical protein [Lysobacter sp. 1R34A]|uniref:hypothetical protein n=1 Tax=Lysobacter sp. 1R34A TaxID=3445786 RepID=UPI003EE8C6D0